MAKANTHSLFTTARVLKNSLSLLRKINKQEVRQKKEPVAVWKTLDDLITNHYKSIGDSKEKSSY